MMAYYLWTHATRVWRQNYRMVGGQSKPIETTASRTRINLIGALSLSNVSKPIISSYTTVDGDAIVDFLHQIRKYSKIKGTIHLVLDQAGYHRCFEVVTAAEKLNMKLFYLPPYSQNLNSIERLWKVMNDHARNNRFFKTADEFRQSINKFLTLRCQKLLTLYGRGLMTIFKS
jgi:transposase